MVIVWWNGMGIFVGQHCTLQPGCTVTYLISIVHSSSSFVESATYTPYSGPLRLARAKTINGLSKKILQNTSASQNVSQSVTNSRSLSLRDADLRSNGGALSCHFVFRRRGLLVSAFAFSTVLNLMSGVAKIFILSPDDVETSRPVDAFS